MLVQVKRFFRKGVAGAEPRGGKGEQNVAAHVRHALQADIAMNVNPVGVSRDVWRPISDVAFCGHGVGQNLSIEPHQICKFPRPQVELVIFGDLDDDAVNRHVEIKGEDLGAFGITRVHPPHRFLQVGVQILLVVYAPDLFFSLHLILLLSWAAATFNHE